MGRRAQGYKVREPTPGAIRTVRFRIDGKRHEYSTGTRDRTEAEREGRRIYAQVLSGEGPGRPAPRFQLTARLAAQWVASLALRPATVADYEDFAGRWLVGIKSWDEHTIAGYIRKRLRESRRKTVATEISGMRGLLRWLGESGEFDLPALPRVPKSALGVQSKQRTRVAAPELTKAEVNGVLRRLPEKSAKGWWVRPRCELLYETGLRPSTIDALSVPEHWQRGSTELRIVTDIDKEGFARDLPLTPRAIAILKHCAPKKGVIFGKHKYYRYIRKAADEAVERRALSPGKAAIFTGQHWRSARLTHLLDAGASLTGTAYVAGHTRVSTTARYARPSKREAVKALKRVG